MPSLSLGVVLWEEERVDTGHKEHLWHRGEGRNDCCIRRILLSCSEFLKRPASAPLTARPGLECSESLQLWEW